MVDSPIDARLYERIRWRARRGLLENDILLERFFAAELMLLSVEELRQLEVLLQLGDNALLDVLMGRKICDDVALRPMAARIVACVAPTFPDGEHRPHPSLPPKHWRGKGSTTE